MSISMTLKTWQDLGFKRHEIMQAEKRKIHSGGEQIRRHGQNIGEFFTRTLKVWVGERKLVWKISLSPQQSFHSESQMAP